MTSSTASSPKAIDRAVDDGIAILRAAGFVIATGAPDPAGTPDEDRCIDLFVATDARELLRARGPIAADDPGCAFILVMTTPLVDDAQRRAIREADLVVCAEGAHTSAAAVALRSPIADLPTTAVEWLDAAVRATSRRAAACRLLPRQPFLGRIQPITTHESSIQP